MKTDIVWFTARDSFVHPEADEWVYELKPNLIGNRLFGPALPKVNPMVKLYGNSTSRASWCLWMLEEMEHQYELVETSLRPEDLTKAEYLRLNPNGRIPTLVDGDLVLWESLAINLYLAQKYEGAMHAEHPEVLALATQWSFWAMLEMEDLLTNLLHHRVLIAELARDASRAERAELLLQRPLKVLNEALAGHEHLLGNGFTVADVNVAGLLSWGKIARLDLSSVPEVKRWLDACLARPAYGRVRDM